MQYSAGGRIAVLTVTADMIKNAGIDESELEGLPSRPLQVVGVDIGITLKERADGTVRASVRTSEAADAAAICSRFSGGGHVRAAGCRIAATPAEAQNMLVAAAVQELERQHGRDTAH
jgi:phosphoesterase RecJ-like protein